MNEIKVIEDHKNEISEFWTVYKCPVCLISSYQPSIHVFYKAVA